MLRLTGSNKLQVVLSGAATASRVTVSYMDFTATATTGGTQLSVTNGATPVDICAAPAASTTRQIDHVRLVAKAAMTPTFSVNDGTAEEWHTVTLASGDVFDWSHSGGAKVLDSGGNVKMVIGGAVAATTITASGLITANAGISIPTGQSVTGAGTATVTGFTTVSATTLTGTLSTAAQTNVTSVGALTGGSIASGFGSINIGANALTAGAGSLSSLALRGSTSGTASFTTNSDASVVILDQGLLAGAISGTTGAFSGAVLTTGQLGVAQLSTGVMDWSAGVNSTRFLSYGPTGVSGSFSWITVIGGGAGTNQMSLSSTGLAVTGTLSVSSIGAFVASDKYLVVDSNGNIHKSATGPAS